MHMPKYDLFPIPCQNLRPPAPGQQTVSKKPSAVTARLSGFINVIVCSVKYTLSLNSPSCGNYSIIMYYAHLLMFYHCIFDCIFLIRLNRDYLKKRRPRVSVTLNNLKTIREFIQRTCRMNTDRKPKTLRQVCSIPESLCFLSIQKPSEG